MKLTDCPVGANLKIYKLYGDEKERSRLWELGIYENSTITVLRTFAGHTVVVEADGAIIAIGKGAAENIEVENA